MARLRYFVDALVPSRCNCQKNCQATVTEVKVYPHSQSQWHPRCRSHSPSSSPKAAGTSNALPDTPDPTHPPPADAISSRTPAQLWQHTASAGMHSLPCSRPPLLPLGPPQCTQRQQCRSQHSATRPSMRPGRMQSQLTSCPSSSRQHSQGMPRLCWMQWTPFPSTTRKSLSGSTACLYASLATSSSSSGCCSCTTPGF